MTIKGDTVTVIAPATLNEGYTFDVTIDGKTFAVAVPPGGVREGETFEAIVADPSFNPPAQNPDVVVMAVPDESDKVISTTSKTIVNNPDGSQTVTEETVNPDGSITKTETIISASAVETGVPQAAAAGSTPLKASPAPTASTVPTGAWRHDLFSCFDVCGNGMFWMSLCCTYIAMGQLLQRLKLNVCGIPGGDYKNTCMIWTILWAVAFSIYWIIVGTTNGYGIFLYYALAIFAIVALTQARYYVRTKWSIPADCCEGSGCLSDCCCVYWCSCCSIIQMMRHTHDEEVDRYNCGSATGLDVGAAEVV